MSALASASLRSVGWIIWYTLLMTVVATARGPAFWPHGVGGRFLNASVLTTSADSSSYIARCLGPLLVASYLAAFSTPGTDRSSCRCSVLYHWLNSSSTSAGTSHQTIIRPVPRLLGIMGLLQFGFMGFIGGR